MQVPADGFIVCNPSDPNIQDVVMGANAKVLDYSEFFNPGKVLKIPGLHNKKNAAAALTVASILAISYTDANESLVNFPGTWRRFEFKGYLSCGALVYDDYAHHPSEIVATLEGFRELYSKEDGWNITILFQPHLFSRTKLLLPDFAKSFNLADSVIILPIYYAREEDDGTISAEILAKSISEYHGDVKAMASFDTAENYICDNLKNMNNKNIIVTMGAGEAFKIGDNLLKG
jgi:UDP-N-acetylmuramate--alanine ligase